MRRPKGSDDQNPSPQSQKPWQSNTFRIWIVVFFALVVWQGYMVFSPSNIDSAEIPYSVFLEQVTDANVQEVTLSGRHVNGEFKSAVPWSNDGTGTQELPTFTKFTTIIPDVDDPQLLPLLRESQVQVSVQSQDTSLLVSILINSLPFLILVGLLFWTSRSMRQAQGGLFQFGKSKAERYSEDAPTVTFNDIAGEEQAKRELTEVVDFLRYPEKYVALGAKIPRGILLVGPPGTGKTLLARAVAGEAETPFFNISGSEFVEMFVGVGASRVRDLFDRAKKESPAIVFIDEIDAVGRRRGAGMGGGNDEREQTLNQILVEMDGFEDKANVIVVAATNRPDVLDPALLRPGRFDRQVTVGLPDRNGRLGILKIHVRGKPLHKDVDLEVLSRSTPGFSGADLANLANEAALHAARQERKKITLADFESALDKIMLGLERPPLMDPHERKVVAYHEAGHAVTARFAKGTDPIHKVTIIPRGRALGVTYSLPDNDRMNPSQTNLTGKLAMIMGGRAAEELIIGEITTGASGDFQQAAKIARQMVTRWGMSEELGVLAIPNGNENPFLGYEMTQNRNISQELASQIDQATRKIVDKAYQEALRLLTEHRNVLVAVAGALLEHETINAEQLRQIWGEDEERKLKRMLMAA